MPSNEPLIQRIPHLFTMPIATLKGNKTGRISRTTISTAVYDTPHQLSKSYIKVQGVSHSCKKSYSVFHDFVLKIISYFGLVFVSPLMNTCTRKSDKRAGEYSQNTVHEYILFFSGKKSYYFPYSSKRWDLGQKAYDC